MQDYEMNRLVVTHDVSAMELIKLKEISPDFANIIKENLTKTAAPRIINKMTFTKKIDLDTDTTKFIGRTWVFSDEEFKTILERACS